MAPEAMAAFMQQASTMMAQFMNQSQNMYQQPKPEVETDLQIEGKLYEKPFLKNLQFNFLGHPNGMAVNK